MAFTDELNRFETGLVQRMRAAFGQTRRAYQQNRRFRATYNELSNLTARELNDLGIARSDIASVARTAANEG